MSSIRIIIIATAMAGGLWVGGELCAAQGMVQAMPPSNGVDQLSANITPYSLASRPPFDAVEASEPGSFVLAPGLTFDQPSWEPGPWEWQLLPEGLIYRSYLAGLKEPRFGCQWIHERDGSFWDIALGGRAGIIRYGTTDPLWSQGVQLDIEGAAFPRLTLDHDRDLVAADFRFGIPLTFRHGRWESKFGYYHLSSHLGDEFLLKHPERHRINFSRDCLVVGLGFRPRTDVRLYAESAWAFYSDGGSEPWEFQFGFEYSPARPASFWGAPFFAVGGHLREEVNFGGEFVVQTGWEWRSPTGRLFRLGLHYMNGKSNQYQFFNEHEEQIGFGTWFDF